MDEQVVVEVRGLRKRYGDRVVLDGLDLEVREAEIVGLLGPNGAGKTTTVECIQGLRAADGGHLRVLGLDPTRQGPQVRALVGSQQQDSALPDRLRVDEAISLFSGPRALPADGLLEAFGLAAHRRRAFAHLSGGQRQRLFLVLALLNRPRLVILDELTQGLDPVARRDVWEALSALRSAGTTVLLVTHAMDEAEALCDRVVVVQGGRVVDEGTPADLVDRHARWATMRLRVDPALGWVDDLAGLPGVEHLERTASGVVLRGRRAMVATVGAALGAHPEVLDGLQVATPGLEDAVLALLAEAGPASTTGTTTTDRTTELGRAA